MASYPVTYEDGLAKLQYNTSQDVPSLDVGSGDGASYIAFDGTNISSFLTNSNAKVINSIAALRNINKNKYTKVFVTGYYAPGDGGGGMYWYDNSDTTSTDNGGTIIKAADGGRWKLIHSGRVTAKQFGAYADGVTNDWLYIKRCIAYAAGTDTVVDLGSCTYYINSVEALLPYEVVSPCFRLPNLKLNIVGSGYTLQSGTGVAALCMFQTTYGSTAQITVSGGKVSGTGNSGGSGYALIDGITINGATQNSEFYLSTDNTKRHGYYIVDGANNNIVDAETISNTCREMLGCGVQIEGASNNIVKVSKMVAIGANGLDINVFAIGGYYPSGTGSPYSSSNTSHNNKVTIGIIDGTGVNTGAVTSNVDDDYYGVNLIGDGNYGNVVNVEIMRNIRVSSGTISPALSTYAAAVRLGAVTKTRVEVGTINTVGPSSSGSIFRASGCIDCEVRVGSAYNYQRCILAPDSNTQGNIFTVGNTIGAISPESYRGLSFKYIQKPVPDTSQDGVVSGWTGAWSHTYSHIDFGIQVTDSGGTYKKLIKKLDFSFPFVILNFEYNISNIANAVPVVGIDESPYTFIALTKDATWHKTSFIIPYTDGSLNLVFSPNNSGTPAAGVVMQLRNLTITLPNGTEICDHEVSGLLNSYPTIGNHSVNQVVNSYSPSAGSPKGWVCTVGGSPGTWVSLGTL